MAPTSNPGIKAALLMSSTNCTDDKTPVACPTCGELPQAKKVGSFWRVSCESGRHVLRPVQGHTMKTKSAAIQEWNREFKR